MITYYNLIKNVCQYFNIQMKTPIYIPTPEDRIKVYTKVSEVAQKVTQKQVQIQFQDQNSNEVNQNARKLSEVQLAQLLQRLTKNTKKQYQIQQQVSMIQQANVEIKKIRKQSQKVQIRLLQQGKRLEHKKAQLVQHHQKQVNKNIRVVPEITQKGKKVKQKAIDQRLDSLLAERKQKQQKLQEKYKQKFQPVIDPHSQFINEIENYGDLQNRMEIKIKQAQHRKQSLRQSIQSRKKQDYTFKPIINQNSKIIAQKIERRPITQRLQSPKMEEEEKLNFVPTINKNTNQILKTRCHSTIDKKCHQRLYEQFKNLKTKQKNRQQKALQQHSFQPQLNNQSLRLASVKRSQTNRFKSINTDQYCEEIKLSTFTIQDNRSKTLSLKQIKLEDPLDKNVLENYLDRRLKSKLNWATSSNY